VNYQLPHTLPRRAVKPRIARASVITTHPRPRTSAAHVLLTIYSKAAACPAMSIAEIRRVDVPVTIKNSIAGKFKSVVLNLFHCWDTLNATDVVWYPQVKIEKVCAPE